MHCTKQKFKTSNVNAIANANCELTTDNGMTISITVSVTLATASISTITTWGLWVCDLYEKTSCLLLVLMLWPWWCTCWAGSGTRDTGCGACRCWWFTTGKEISNVWYSSFVLYCHSWHTAVWHWSETIRKNDLQQNKPTNTVSKGTQKFLLNFIFM